MVDFLERVGGRIRNQRRKKGYGISEVANICGVQYHEIRLIESGRCKAPYSLYEDICYELGTTMEEVLRDFRWTYAEPHTANRGDGSRYE